MTLMPTPPSIRQATRRVAHRPDPLRPSNSGRDLGVPLHQLIRRHLERLLVTRTLQPGDQIPTELELMAAFSVSRITVRQAIAQLVASGALVARPGRGTFVAKPRIPHQLSKLTGFVEDMDSLGIKVHSNVLSIASLRADMHIAERLRIPEGANITRIERVRYANDEPLSFDISNLSAAIGSRLAAEDLTTNPIFSLLEDKYGVKLAEADYSIEASAAPTKVARLLNVRRGAPVLLIERTTYSEAGCPVDHEHIYYRGDRIRYLTTLKR